MEDIGPFPSESHAVKCELAAEVLRSTGKLRLQVTGWSMLPSIFPGDTLLVERAGGDEVREGDIVLVSRDRRLFAHRVIGKMAGNSGVQTRGDAMAAPDLLVREKEMIGKVVLISRNGKQIRPRQLRAAERAVAALVQRSALAGRIVVGVHSLRLSPA